MNTEKIIKYSKRNKTSTYNSVDRDDFVCLEINIANESQWMKRICSYAQKIVPNLNVGQANSSEVRELWNFLNLLAGPKLRLYVTGGATKNMMKDSNYYQIKHLTPAGGQVRVESDYRVIPLSRSLDINEFFEVLETENDKLVVTH